MNNLPDYEYLTECFYYNQETGEFLWKERPLSHFKDKRTMTIINSRTMGKPAGSSPKPGNKCSHVRILGQYFSIKKIIWKLVNKVDPTGILKFADGDHNNLKYDNLSYRFHNTKSSGYKWVSNSNGKYTANVMYKGEVIHLGTFDDPEQAHLAAVQKKEELSQLQQCA